MYSVETAGDGAIAAAVAGHHPGALWVFKPLESPAEREAIADLVDEVVADFVPLIVYARAWIDVRVRAQVVLAPVRARVGRELDHATGAHDPAMEVVDELDI